MSAPFERLFNPEDFHPQVRDVFANPPMNPKRIHLVGIPIEDPHKVPALTPLKGSRCVIDIVEGENFWTWEVESLRGLFRGDRKPPVLGAHPEAYEDSFVLLDLHALEISKFFGDRTDGEMLEIYSSLRRRPDGRSLGFVHDYMWKAAAFVVGTRPLSQAEFEAIMARLEQSCRTFQMGLTSRNYVETLRQTIGQWSE